MRPTIFLLLLFASLMPAEAMACSGRTPAGQQKAEREQRFYLAKADRVVTGVWTSGRLDEGEQAVTGRIVFSLKGRQATMRADRI